MPSLTRAQPRVLPRTYHAPAIVLLLGGYSVLTWLVADFGFFWDSVLLGSTYGNWYYTHSFRYLFVPGEIAGYPPLFGMYLAAGWHLWGQSLPVSHLLMLPLLWGIVVQVYLLARKFLPEKSVLPGVGLLLLEPTLLAQSTQVAPDVGLVFLYLLGLNALLAGNRKLLAVGLVFLGMLSPRGMMAVAALLLTDVLVEAGDPKPRGWGRWLLSKSWAYGPALLVVTAWLVLHYRHFGWVGYNPDSAWGAYTQVVDWKGLLRNGGILAWRLLDFGRVAGWLAGAVVVGWLYKRRKPLLPPNTRKLLALIASPLLVYAPVFLLYTNPIGHRYLIVVYLLVALLVLHYLFRVTDRRLRAGLYGLMLAGFVGGHFIVYPDPVAKGWDATLAHLPYYTLRRQMIGWMDEHQVPVSGTGSDFPNLSSFDEIDLNGDPRSFQEADFSRNRYLFHSNIYNGFSDEQLQELQEKWPLLKEFRSRQVYVRLYRNPAVE